MVISFKLNAKDTMPADRWLSNIHFRYISEAISPDDATGIPILSDPSL